MPETIEGAARMLQGMSGMNGATLPDAFTKIHPALTLLLGKLHITGVTVSGTVFTTKWALIFMTSLVLFLPNSIQYVNNIFSNKNLSHQKLFACAVLTSILLSVSVIAINRPSEFLYFQF